MVKILIQPKTLEALNYFLDEDLESRKDSLKEMDQNSKLASYYMGYINALKYAKELVNQKWKSE
jgi:hypothetical protein